MRVRVGKQLASCSEHFLEFRIISDTSLSPSCLPKMPFLCFFWICNLKSLWRMEMRSRNVYSKSQMHPVTKDNKTIMLLDSNNRHGNIVVFKKIETSQQDVWHI